MTQDYQAQRIEAAFNAYCLYRMQNAGSEAVAFDAIKAALEAADSVQCAKGCGDAPKLDERLESVIRTLINGISVQSLEAKHGNLCEALEKLKKHRTPKGD